MSETIRLLAVIAISGALFTGLNLAILALNLKLYTEVLKDRNAELRRRGAG